jgi:hypothetical protein
MFPYLIPLRCCAALLCTLAGALAGALVSSPSWAAPYVPARDDTVLETLPYRLFRSAAQQALPPRPVIAVSQAPSSTAAMPDAAATNAAIQLARQDLEQARERGDPRFAGYALAALRPWRDQAQPPAAIVLMQATLDQYQHDFSSARTRLLKVLQSAPHPQVMAQAWLTLATIERVQGRYAESDRACNGLARLSSSYALACLAENAGLRGQNNQGDGARKQLNELLVSPGLQGVDQMDTRRWLLTTLAELDERAGRATHAERLYRQALASTPKDTQDGYLIFAYADFLLAQSRPKEVLRLLAHQPEPASDGVLLRRAIAEKKLGLKQAEASAAQLADRFEAARQRGDGAAKHGRELARFQLQVQGDAAAALINARANLLVQKEPVDWLVMTQAAVAANDTATLRDLKTRLAQQGLNDTRIERLLQAHAS